MRSPTPPSTLQSGIGALEGIFVIRAPKGPPIPLQEAHFRLEGGVPTDQRDRPGVKRPVSAICAEALDAVAAALGIAIAPGASRRNLTVRGIDLDALVIGTRLRVGDAAFELIDFCDACARMESAIAPGASGAMQGRGGVILAVREEGLVRVGDAVRVEAVPARVIPFGA